MFNQQAFIIRKSAFPHKTSKAIPSGSQLKISFPSSSPFPQY